MRLKGQKGKHWAEFMGKVWFKWQRMGIDVGERLWTLRMQRKLKEKDWERLELGSVRGKHNHRA